jgi:hypothetical protein
MAMAHVLRVTTNKLKAGEVPTGCGVDSETPWQDTVSGWQPWSPCVSGTWPVPRYNEFTWWEGPGNRHYFDADPADFQDPEGDEMRYVSKGQKGNGVAELQAKLVLLGYDLGTYGPDENGVDGHFGSLTVAALAEEQARAVVNKFPLADEDDPPGEYAGPRSWAWLDHEQGRSGDPGGLPPHSHPHSHEAATVVEVAD